MTRPLLLTVAALDPKKRGSLEDQFAAIARAVAARGGAMRLVVAREPAEAVATLWRAAGLRWEVAELGRPLVAAAQVGAIGRRLRPSLVHFHFLRATSPAVLWGALAGSRVIVNDHMALVDGSRGLRRGIKRLLHRAVGRGIAGRAPIDRRIAVSSFVAATVVAAEAVDPERVVVVENGIDLARFRPARVAAARAALGVDGPAIACVARMAPGKGVEVAIRALARLRSPSARRRGAAAPPTLLVVGDGPDREACARLAAALGVARRVRFLGLRDDVETVLSACDQAWVPSRVPEAFGLAAAEAMAAARPVVASRVGGLPEVVVDGETGLLVPPADDAALAAAAQALLDAPVHARTMGLAGRARAEERFGMDRFVERLLAVYADVAPPWPINAGAWGATFRGTPRRTAR